MRGNPELGVFRGRFDGLGVSPSGLRASRRTGWATNDVRQVNQNVFQKRRSQLSQQTLRLNVNKPYQNFRALWKDADPDIPILKQAKDEYAKLQ